VADLWSDAEKARRWEASHLEGNPTRAGHLELLVELLAAAGPGCCLDLGCGSGLVAERILDRHEDLQVFGVDSSPPMLEMARARLDASASECGWHKQTSPTTSSSRRWTCRRS